MKFNIPWIVSRRRVLTAATIDYFICTFLYNFVFKSEFNNDPNNLVTITFTFFWIIMSYVLGRYVKTNKITFVSISKLLIKSTLLLILCNGIYLFVNWGYPLLFFWTDVNFFNADLRDLSNFFIRVTIYIVSASTLVQFQLGIIAQNIYDKKEEWIFYGTEKKYKEVINEISRDKNEIILIWIEYSDSLELIDINNIRGIVIEDFSIIDKKDMDLIFNYKLRGLAVNGLLDWFENQFHRMPTNLINNKYQLLEKLKSIEDNYHIRIKRIGDIIVSIFILLISLPITLLVCVFIFIEDKGPIFYQQKRTGLKGKIIKIYKFRSMKIDAEKNGIQWAKKSDPRITKMGALIRATRIDELPQLISVIKGDMSLIGPRPERPEIEFSSLGDIPYYNCRNLLKPGISGWAQVNYPYGSSIDDAKNKLSYDIYYIHNFSNLLDFVILFKTIKLVLNLRGAIALN